MKLAFKATNSDLTCRKEQFEVGKQYTKDIGPKLKPSLCTSDGYHYCNSIHQLWNFYTKGVSRVWIIEVTGKYTEDREKGITTQFTLLKEITDIYEDQSKVDVVMEYENRAFQERKKEYFMKQEMEKKALETLKERAKKYTEEIEGKMKHNLHLELVKEFLINNPLAIVGGSVALFLHGVRLPRWIDYNTSDIDIILPYYMPFNTGDQLVLRDSTEEHFSGRTFTEIKTIEFKNPSDGKLYRPMSPVKIEALISPTETWEYIEYEGFKYKVNSLRNIWAAKLSYNKSKHNDDLKEACKNDTQSMIEKYATDKLTSTEEEEESMF